MTPNQGGRMLTDLKCMYCSGMHVGPKQGFNAPIIGKKAQLLHTACDMLHQKDARAAHIAAAAAWRP